jgi:hypothetical protein
MSCVFGKDSKEKYVNFIAGSAMLKWGEITS